MDEALVIMEELLTILDSFAGGTEITEMQPASGKTPPLERSISLGEMVDFFSAIEQAHTTNAEPSAAVIASGRDLLARARWHEVNGAR